MSDFPVGLIVFLLVIAGSILKPWLERRKKRMEEEQRRQRGAARPEVAEAVEVEEEDDGPKLPYEDLVDEVFGPYMKRRREAAQQKPPPQAPAPAPVVAAAVEEAPAPPIPPSPEAWAEEPSPEVKLERVGRRTEALSIEQRVFGNRSLSPMAKLVLAAEILQPPRALRGRGGALRR